MRLHLTALLHKTNFKFYFQPKTNKKYKNKNLALHAIALRLTVCNRKKVLKIGYINNCIVLLQCAFLTMLLLLFIHSISMHFSFSHLLAQKIVNWFLYCKYIKLLNCKKIKFSSPLHCKVYTKRHKMCIWIVSKVLSTVTKVLCCSCKINFSTSST